MHVCVMYVSGAALCATEHQFVADKATGEEGGDPSKSAGWRLNKCS